MWFGVATSMLTLGIWLGPGFISRRKAKMPTSDEQTPVAAKIDYVLTEARVVLPGAQAILGFQLSIVLTTAFADLSSGLKFTHGASLALIAISTALLIAPASYHRIVYEGRDDPAFQHVASKLVLAATGFLAMGISLDAYVVTFKVGNSNMLSSVFALLVAIGLTGMWHIWPWLCRRTENTG
jgi:hypothetical protein